MNLKKAMSRVMWVARALKLEFSALCGYYKQTEKLEGGRYARSIEGQGSHYNWV
jgi:hypothetical protein